jgi:hypothetical protein
MTMSLQPKIVEYITASGVVLWITPLSRQLFGAIKQQAADKYPLPNKEDYEEEHPEGVAGLKIPAKANPEYNQKLADALTNQSNHILSAMNDLCIQYPKYQNGKHVAGQFYSQDDLIEEFKPRLDAIRPFADVPDDLWEATYQFCILGSPDDEKQISMIVRDQLPISQEEVDREMRLFRHTLPRSAIKLLAGKQSAPGAEGTS